MILLNINNSMQSLYQNMSSLKRISSAKDDPAGMAISQKMKSQTDGYETSINNIDNMNNLNKVAQGGLSSINSSLQRIRELSLQASNGILSDGDKNAIQGEITQLKEGISEVSKNTQFNTVNLLDGSFEDKSVASNPDGTGRTMSIGDFSLEGLGMSDFDVTKDFDIRTIDNALSKVSSAQGKLGATYNSLNSNSNYNSVARENIAAANSRIEDLDIGEQITRLNTKNLLQQVQYQMQQKQMDNEVNKIDMLL